MSTTVGELKVLIFANVFPTGQAPNLVAAHNKMFVDALIDLQTVVDCLQQDNTSLIDQCATFYNCGLTVFDAPRGAIKKVSVVDRINPTTHLEDATQPIDWCSEIPYNQVDYCHVRRYLGSRRGCCGNIPLFFGLPFGSCNKAWFPVPADAGVPAGLPILPLGFHYPQTSTDRLHGRALAGIWALERGKIWVAPWIQSSETLMVVWDGIKRSWAEGDPIDDDPLLAEALEEYVRWKHADKYDKDDDEMARAGAAYAYAKQKLIHQCREETRVRECEPSHARSSSPSLTSLFYNDPQSATASCPTGQTGNPVTVVIPAGQVASNISVADANAKAQAQAQSQATAQLSCSPVTATFSNTAQTAVAGCATTDAAAPPPDGNPVTVTIKAGTITSTVSQSDADQQALVLAKQQAAAQLSCVWWNSAQTATAICQNNNPAGNKTSTVAAHTYSSTLSQDDANNKALTAAQNAANALLDPGCSVSGVFWNTAQIATFNLTCGLPPPGGTCSITVNCTVAAHYVSSTISQADANQKAMNAGLTTAHIWALSFCNQGNCGVHNVNLP